MDFESFKEHAENLGFSSEDKINYFMEDGVGVAYYRGKYVPVGCALCKHWSDDILLEIIRQQVLLDGTANIALDYLELLSSLEREDDGPLKTNE